MSIKNGELTNADEVMNAFGLVFKNYSQLLFNAARVGFNANLNDVGSPELKNTDYSAFTSDTMTKSYFRYDSVQDNYLTGVEDATLTTLDEFADSSINTSIWDTSAGVSETGTILRLETNGSNDEEIATTDNAIFSTYGEVVRILLNQIGYLSGSGTSCTFYVEITDGTNTVSIDAIGTGTSSMTTPTYFLLSFDGTNTVYYRQSQGTYTQTAWNSVDISTVTGTRKLRLRARNGATGTGNYRAEVDWVRYWNPPQTSVLTSPTHNASETITNAILSINTNLNHSATYYLSANGGTNWETVTPNEIHRFTNTGTQLKMKVELSSVANEHTISKINEYAVMYNFY